MAPIKRKADQEGSRSKYEKNASTNHSAKRPRKSDATASSPKQAAAAAPVKLPKTQQTSVFKDEEKSFPRGGASVLTPLEHKQIQIKATQDVLFEQSGQKRAADAGLSEEEAEDGAEVKTSAGKKSRKTKKSKNAQPEESHERKVRVESLSYRKLAPGSMVLGQISQITGRDLVLSLPNNLNGYVPITSISDKLTEKIEKLVEEEEDDDKSIAESEDFEDIDLADMYHIGQYLRAYVVSTSEDASAHGGPRAKKRIELSINPKHANRGISKSDLSVNCTVQASVVSNEDHGLVMDLGLEGADLKGFMSSNALGPGLEHSKIKEGAVFLCLVTGLNADGRIVKLSADHLKAGDVRKTNYLADAPTIDVFLPGTAVDMLVTDSSKNTVTGKIMGHLDATADIIHSGAAESDMDLSEKYKAGSKVKARIVCTFPRAEPKKVGVSLLEHVVMLKQRISVKGKVKSSPIEKLPVAAFVEEAKVIKVDPMNGLYLDIGVPNVSGFAHISRLTEGKIERLSEDSGPYKLGSTHRARVVGYNPMDGLFQLSLEPRVLEQPFIRFEDVKAGQVVKGKVEKLIIQKTGSAGVIVNLSDGITGLVPELHMADVALQHPERKFREGASVTARVLSTDPNKRQIRLTLKKSLVNSDVKPWTDYSQISEGDSNPGTLGEVKPNGAVVHFYGHVRGWLPVAEMSEAYVSNATQHFHKGKVVNVHVISIDPTNRRMVVSCKDPTAVDVETVEAFKSLGPGDIVKGTVTEKSADFITVDLGKGVKGTLRMGQLTDGSEKKDKASFSRIRVGGPLEDLIVLDKFSRSRTVLLSNKPSLRQDAQAKHLICRFEDVREGESVHGFVRGITPERIFVEFGAGLVGLLFKSQLPEEMAQLVDFGLRKDQSITVRVSHVDYAQQRFWLSMKPESEESDPAPKPVGEEVVNSLDTKITSTADLRFGTETTARIRSVKNTQLNVHLADNVQGRISVAEIFDDWNDIKDKKHPLRQFEMNQMIPVKVLGMHDARNHRFLPITHRQGKVPVYELTARNKTKFTSESDLPALEKITVGSEWIAFVNNYSDRFVWVNISANIRGRIDLLELSDDVSLLGDVENNFPIGCALKARVKAVDASAGRLDLTAVTSPSVKSMSWDSLKVGLVLPARVTKVTDSSVVVQINEHLAGPVFLEELADDYDLSKPSDHKVGEIVRVCITEIDVPNKKLGLSMRPSKVLSSSLQVKDPEVTDISQLKVNQVVRGFIKRVIDSGIFVRLGHHLDAYVKVSDLSDSFIKDWKSEFQVDKLVKGKIISADPSARNPQMSLKASVLEKDYVPLVTYNDMKVGQIVTGTIRKVENYGVFIVVDHSNNVSGLCHRSEIADKAVTDVKALFKEGDAVKAKVLTADPSKRRVTFGLKYSYIKGTSDEDGGVDMEDSDKADENETSEEDDEDVEVVDEDSEQSEAESEDADTREVQSVDSDEELEHDGEVEGNNSKTGNAFSGLSTSGFDWTGATLDLDDQGGVAIESDDDAATKKKKRHRKAEIKEDRTGDLDAHGPQSVADYERLLLGQPHSAELWVRYMVFQRELNEIEKARQIARRALATINPREEKERLDVWTALLHLENDFSNDDAIEEVFKEACQYNDARQVHERMIKIYISSGKLDKADSLYQAMMKNKSFTPSPTFWLSYASFLMSTLQPPSPARARALLPRATQSVPEAQHRYLTTKFAALEFKSPNGDAERGRTLFEGLVAAWPKKADLWDVYLDLEIAHGGEDNVRLLFERMTKGRLRRKRGEKVWAKWVAWERGTGSGKGVDRVVGLRDEWVKGLGRDEEADGE